MTLENRDDNGIRAVFGDYLERGKAEAKAKAEVEAKVAIVA
jgi:hypothetical protein